MAEMVDQYGVYNNRCQQLLQDMRGRNGGAVAPPIELMDSLEQKAREEYDGFIHLFVDSGGDISKRYTWKERTVDRVLSIIPGGFKKRFEHNLEQVVVERCVQDYLQRMNEEVTKLKQKAGSAETRYEDAIEAVTFLRIEYINQLGEAETCHTEREKGATLLVAAQHSIDALLGESKVAEAREVQRTYIETEKHVRLFGRERDRRANHALTIYHQLTLMQSVYEQAKVYSQFLGKVATILAQTYEHLNIRWQEYKNSGNVGDVLGFIRWNEELKHARDVFEKNFVESLPLIRRVDRRVNDQVGSKGRGNNTDMGVFDRARSLRDKVMELGPM